MMDEKEFELSLTVDRRQQQAPAPSRYQKRRNSDVSIPKLNKDHSTMMSTSSPSRPRKRDNDDDTQEQHDQNLLPPRKRAKLSPSPKSRGVLLIPPPRIPDVGPEKSENINPNFNPNPGSGPDLRNFLDVLHHESGCAKSPSTDVGRTLDVDMDMDVDVNVTNPISVESPQKSLSYQRTSRPWTSYFTEGGRGGQIGVSPALMGSFSSYGSHRSHRFVIYEDPDDMEIDCSHVDESSWYFSPDDDKENTEEETTENLPFHTFSQMGLNSRLAIEQGAHYSSYIRSYTLPTYATTTISATDDDPQTRPSRPWPYARRLPADTRVEANTDDEEEEEERSTDPDPEIRREEDEEIFNVRRVSLGSLNATEISLQALPGQSPNTSSDAMMRARFRSQRLRSLNSPW